MKIKIIFVHSGDEKITRYSLSTKLGAGYLRPTIKSCILNFNDDVKRGGGGLTPYDVFWEGRKL